MQKPFSSCLASPFVCTYDDEDDFCFERRRHVDVVFSHCLPLINGIESKALAFWKFFRGIFRSSPTAFAFWENSDQPSTFPPHNANSLALSTRFQLLFDEFQNGYSDRQLGIKSGNNLLRVFINLSWSALRTLRNSFFSNKGDSNLSCWWWAKWMSTTEIDHF